MANSEKVKVTQLPIYECCCSSSKACCHKKPPATMLEPYITNGRLEIEAVMKPILGDYPQKISDISKTSYQFVNDTLEVVKDEKNQVARAVFITSSGFLGFILGKKGFIKRSTFGIIGALAAASYCNPEQAKDYADVSYKLAKSKLNEALSQYDLSQFRSMLNITTDKAKADK